MDAVHHSEAGCVGIGDWLLDVGSQRLRRGAEACVLGPKEIGVLLHLAETAPDLVATEQLLERSWPEVVVGDQVLHEVIGRLRKILGDSARQPTYIETLHKRGYRLIAPVQPAPAEGSVADGVAPRDWPGAHTIAVVPFEDLSPSQELGWLAAGFRETLLGRLSRIEQLRVIRASRSLESHRDATLAGQDIHAGTLVCGSIYPAGDSLTLTVQLLEAQTGMLLWSADYAVAGEAAEPQIPLEAVRAIETVLGIRAPASTATTLDLARYGTHDVRAYTLWRKQLALKFTPGVTEDDVVTALDLSRQAVTIDPEYVMGHVGVGMAHLMLSRRRSDLRDLKHAERAFERAVELGPRHPIALANLALVASLCRQWDRVVAVVRQAEPWTAVAEARGIIQLYVWSLVNLGRWAEAELALEAMRRLMATAPERYYALNVDVAEATFWLTGDAPAAATILGQDGRHHLPGGVLPPEAGSPPGSPPVQLSVHVHPKNAFLYYYAGREEDAAAVFLGGLSDPDLDAGRRGYANDGWEGMLRCVAASRLEHPGAEPSHSIPTADVWAALGEREAMYECLERQQAIFECYLEKDAEHAHECGPGASCTFAIPIWTAQPYRAYLSEPRFQHLLDAYGVIGHLSYAG